MAKSSIQKRENVQGHFVAIVPCYFEEVVLQSTFQELQAQLAALPVSSFQVLFVDDGSQDGTWQLIQQFAQSADWVSGIRLSRNFGQQSAIWAGIQSVDADYVAILDSDLQDPPELLGPMLEKLVDSGAACVYGLRTERKGESGVRSFASFAYYRLLDSISSVTVPLDAGDFRIFDRRILAELHKMNIAKPYVRGLVPSVGFDQLPFEYARPGRAQGVSKYSLSKLIDLALSGFVQVGDAWPKLFLMLGLFLVGLSPIFGLAWLVGFKALVGLILFVLGIATVVGIAFAGYYLVALLRNQQGRAAFVIAETANSEHLRTPSTLGTASDD